MNCPRCEVAHLYEKTYEGIDIDTCPQCKGVWLDNSELTDIVRIREVKFTPEIIKQAISSAKVGVPKDEIETELNCPICKDLLIPINYAISSGIIIDRCPKEHGLWFDNSELETIQAYREHWQDQSSDNQKKLTELIDNLPEPKKDRSHSVLFSIAEFFSKYL